MFTHELWRIRNQTRERSERVRFLIQNNECVNTVQSTFHVVLCLWYTYWDWTPPLNYDKLYWNKLTSRLSTYSSTEESWITKRFSLMAFAETGTFNINDWRNANKNYLLSSRLAKRWLVRCTKPRQPALNENFNLPYGSHVKKHDTRLLIGRIAFLTCGKSDTRHLIGLHRFANENLLCGFSVCKSQYVYNN